MVTCRSTLTQVVAHATGADCRIQQVDVEELASFSGILASGKIWIRSLSFRLATVTVFQGKEKSVKIGPVLFCEKVVYAVFHNSSRRQLWQLLRQHSRKFSSGRFYCLPAARTSSPTLTTAVSSHRSRLFHTLFFTLSALSQRCSHFPSQAGSFHRREYCL